MDKYNASYTFHLHSTFAQLLALIRRGHYEDVVALIHSEPSILKLRDRLGRSALHYCADSMPSTKSSTTRPNVTADIGQLLTRMVPSMVEWQDNEGNIPLHLAIINGDVALVRTLLRAMSSNQINIADYELHTVIHWAVVSGQFDSMALALEHGANPSTPDIYGAYPLHYATQSLVDSISHFHSNLSAASSTAVSGATSLSKISKQNGFNNRNISQQHRANSLRIIHHLLTQLHIDVNCIDNEQRTPLIWAASSGNHDALLVLVKGGAEISQQDKDGLSALHCASSRGHYKCVHTLITMCGADVHQLDSGGCTPLFYAVALGHPDCVRLLIESGAKLNHQDHKGRTAAHCGASKGQLETLKILQEHGADLWMKNVRGDLPLHDAVKSGRIDLVTWLLEQSPQFVNEMNAYGRTPLHIAAFNHNLEMCRLLIKYGAKVNSIMKIRQQYLTPLDAALQNGDLSADDELISYLQNLGGLPIGKIDKQLLDEDIRKSHLEESYKKFFEINSKPIKYGREHSRSKSREAIKSPESDFDEFYQHKKSKSKQPRFKIEPEIESKAKTFESKLPHLNFQEKNGEENQKQRAISNTLTKSISSSSISSQNSVLNSSHHNRNHHYSDHIKNIREFETVLNNDESDDTKNSTHLKQAIITNVYLTPVATAALAPVETTAALTTNTAIAAAPFGAALLPVYYVKRVPPLKKLSSSSLLHKKMKKISKTPKKNLSNPGTVSVVLESHDTLESATGQFREQHSLVEEELVLGKKMQKKSSKEEEMEINNEEKDNEEDAENEIENTEEITDEKPEMETNIIDELNNDQAEMMDQIANKIDDEFTPDSGFETEVITRKESLLPGVTELGTDSDKIQETEFDLSLNNQHKDDFEKKSANSSFELETEKPDENSAGWLQSKLEILSKTTKETINETIGMANDKFNDGEEKTDTEIFSDIVNEDFVINEEQYNDGDDERIKRSAKIEQSILEKQQSHESLNSKIVDDEVFEQTEENKATNDNHDQTERTLLIVIEKQKQDSNSHIEELLDNENISNEIIHDDSSIVKSVEGNITDTIMDQDLVISDDLKQDFTNLTEVDELMEKKEISFKNFDDDEKYNQHTKTDDIIEKLTPRLSEDTTEKIESIKPEAFNTIIGIKTESDGLTDKIYDSNNQLKIENSQFSPDDHELITKAHPIRRGSYTKEILMETAKEENENSLILKPEEISSNDGPKEMIESHKDSSFGPVRQLKGKKKSYDYVRPKVDSYWSDEYYQHHNMATRSSGMQINTSKHRRFKKDKHGGSTGYLASTSHDDYSQIDPKYINQTVEKYLRKYYLERQLFEELYDLKRYQIRTGKSNEPQSVRRLVERFRREMKAPGMSDFKGPFTYRAYEMYLYDLLRQLSQSNQKKLAYLTKSISYEDLATSFERMQSEMEGMETSNEYYHRLYPPSKEYYYNNVAGPNNSDISSETSENIQERDKSATTHHHRAKYDPLFNYDQQPFGLVVDYKYEYHKSQHRATVDSGSDEGGLVDVICENLYKRTGMHGSKMDEMAVSRKIVERSGNEEDTTDDTEKGSNEKKYSHRKNIHKKNTELDSNDEDYKKKVWVHNDDDKNEHRSYSRCYVYGHLGPSSANTGSRNHQLNAQLVRLAKSRKPRLKRSIIPKRIVYKIPMDKIQQRWNRIKKNERQRILKQTNNRFTTILDNDITLWFELNQNWRPKIEIHEPY